MVHFYSYAEFHADPLPRAVGDICDNGSIIKDGLSDPCAGAGAGGAGRRGHLLGGHDPQRLLGDQ